METKEKVVGVVEEFFKEKNLYILLQLFWIVCRRLVIVNYGDLYYIFVFS